MQKKDLEEAREIATKHAEEKAPKFSAGDAEAQYNEAFALHDKGAYKEAERAFSYFIKRRLKEINRKQPNFIRRYYRN